MHAHRLTKRRSIVKMKSYVIVYHDCEKLQSTFQGSKRVNNTCNKRFITFLVQGRWASWSAWTPCTCGDTTISRHRSCVRERNSDFCIGNSFEKNICEPQNCQTTTGKVKYKCKVIYNSDTANSRDDRLCKNTPYQRCFSVYIYYIFTWR